MSDLKTPDEAAEKLRSNPRTLERWRTQGIGPAYVKIGRRVAYTDQDLDDYVAKQRRQHTADSSR